MATAARERMMHLRSSSRCCSRLMEPICLNSRSMSFCSGSETNSGIVILRDRVLDALAQAVEGALDGKVFVVINFCDLRLQVLGGVSLFQFHFADLIVNLALEFIAGLFKL